MLTEILVPIINIIYLQTNWQKVLFRHNVRYKLTHDICLPF